MAIDTLGAALRQLNRLFAKGVVAGLSDAQLLELSRATPSTKSRVDHVPGVLRMVGPADE
jgi:hypothetical protein